MNTIKQNDIHIPIEKVTSPCESGIFAVIIDSWWIVVNDCIILHNGEWALCNDNQKVAVSLAKSRNAGIQKIPVVYLPVRSLDCYYEGIAIEKLKHDNQK